MGALRKVFRLDNQGVLYVAHRIGNIQNNDDAYKQNI